MDEFTSFYITKIPLNKHNRKFMTTVERPSIFHGCIEQCFEGERKRRIWRLDSIKGEYFILLVSEDKPDVTDFCRQFDCDAEKCVTKEYSRLFDKIEVGSRWQFRIIANPTKSICTDKTNKAGRGKVISVLPKDITGQSDLDMQKKWLMNKGDQCGFNLEYDSFIKTGTKWYQYYKTKNNRVTFLAVSFEGILTVTDKEKFIETLCCGIGREKAYGMGMITIL